MSFIGWLGSIMLAVCAAPAAYKAYMDKHADGVSGPFIGLWLGGELLTLVYVAPDLNWPLIANYGANIFFVGIIAYYKWSNKIKFPEYVVEYPTLEMEEFLYDALAKADVYHSIDGSGSKSLIFSSEDFAPGMWAGMEGWEFSQGYVKYRISKVDLENRALSIEKVALLK